MGYFKNSCLSGPIGCWATLCVALYKSHSLCMPSFKIWSFSIQITELVKLICIWFFESCYISIVGSSRISHTRGQNYRVSYLSLAGNSSNLIPLWNNLRIVTQVYQINYFKSLISLIRTEHTRVATHKCIEIYPLSPDLERRILIKNAVSPLAI